MINDILQDREGFLWIATKDGLNRYDGNEFKIFTNNPNNPRSISDNHIVKLFEDSSGRIWATTNTSGINIFDKKSGHFHQLLHNSNDSFGLTGNFVTDIVEDTSGYFILTIDREEINIFRLDENFFYKKQSPQVTRIPMPSEPENNIHNKNDFNLTYRKLRGIVKDSKHRIWVSGHNTIYQLNVQTAELKTVLEDYHFDNATPDSNGSIWGSSFNRLLFKWNGVNVNDYQIDNPTGGILESIEIINDSTLFAITKNNFHKFEVGKIPSTTPNAENNIFHDVHPLITKYNNFVMDHPLRSMTLDRSGIIWFGTNGYGIFKMDPNSKRFSHKSPGLSIRNIITNPNGKTLLQDYGQQWFNPDKTCFTGVKMQTWINDCAIGDILVSKSGDYWLSYLSYKSEGVDHYWTKDVDLERLYLIKKYDPLSKQSQTYPISWHHSDSQPIIETEDGSIWMAGYNDVLSQLDPISGDVLSYDIKSGDQIKVKEGKEVGYFSEDSSTALYEDADRNLWVGTERGITKCIRPPQKGGQLQVKQFKNISGDQNSLSYNHVTCFLDDPVDSDSYLWVCTKGGGLNRFDKKAGTFMNLTKKDGLPDNVIYGILPDEDGNIWGSTNRGIFSMSPNKDVDGDNQGAYIFRNFSKADGLQENEFNTGAYEKLPNGQLAFGGINGYNVFNPKEVLSSDYQPPIYITNILVNNQPVSPGDESGILENTIETTQEITLSNLDNILTLEFAALDFTSPDHNRYRYQLIGADDTWLDAGNQRSATFLNLRPNDYTFRVQGSNSQGIWSNKIAQLKITVLPPWWFTWCAYLIYALFAMFLFWRYFKFINNRAKLNQQLIFEKNEAEKAKELDLMKTRLYTNLTHEFRTPLTIIIGMVDQIKVSTERNKLEGLDMIKRNGENLLQLVNRMLDLSKIESGKMMLNARQGDIIQTLKNVSDSFVGYAANKEIALHFLSDLDQKNMIFDDEKIRHIFSNLISNAIKFTLAGGNIYISVRQQENDLLIKVKDTGKGILPDQLDKVFERFYQIESEASRTSEGTGIGLALCKELVFLMDGKISVQSPPPGSEQGSEFTVLLPTSGVLKDRKSIERSSSNLQVAAPKSAVQKQAVAKVPTPISEIRNNEHKESEKVILLVEDNVDIVAYVALCLKDYKLIVATNGVEGLEMAIESIPDLIVSDVMMPIMDGFEMCEKIKKDGRTNHIPVVILTAKADLESKIEGLEFGANAYLSKPFDTDELLLTVRNLFNLRTKLQAHYQFDINARKLEVSTETLEVANLQKLDEFVIEVREKIEAKINDYGLSVEVLAKELHFSQSQFSRKLTALTGMTPVKYIRQIRLEKAKGMLLDPAISINVIAYDCGFNDPSYFSRIFKNEFGITPKDWRNLN